MTCRATVTAAAAAIAILAGGCSDDVVCPEAGQGSTLPYVSALVVERSDGRLESTHVEIECTADPTPILFVPFVNGREIPRVDEDGTPGELAILDDDLLLCQPGVQCLLEVTTNYGQATAEVSTPEAPDVTAPSQITVADTLTLVWRTVTDADYYQVSAVLLSGVEAATAPADVESITLWAVTLDTVAVFPPGDLPTWGTLTGSVEAVAGPFPESGGRGNGSGSGWGFFTVRYADAGSAFEVAVSDTL